MHNVKNDDHGPVKSSCACLFSLFFVVGGGLFFFSVCSFVCFFF